MFKDVLISRSKEFSIDDLSQELENITLSMKKVLSKKFMRLAMKHMVKKSKVDITDQEKEEIFVEVDNEVESNFDAVRHFDEFYRPVGPGMNQ